MQVAMLAAGFSAGEANQLRRAMAAWKRKGGPALNRSGPPTIHRSEQQSLRLRRHRPDPCSTDPRRCCHEPARLAGPAFNRLCPPRTRRMPRYLRIRHLSH